MSDDTTLHAEPRQQFGKGFARRLRTAGQIPAVIYGHGTDPVHVALPGHEMSLLVRRANALIELDVEGKNHLTIVKDVQRDPVRHFIEHVDLLVVRRGEKINVDVPVTVIGEPDAGTIANLDATTLTLEVEATHIPEHIEVDVDGLEDGARLTAGDISLPAGATLVTESETLVVAVYVPTAAPEPESEAEEESEAGGETAETEESDSEE